MTLNSIQRIKRNTGNTISDYSKQVVPKRNNATNETMFKLIKLNYKILELINYNKASA